MVARQYPYVLQVLNLSGSSKDANGNYIAQTETWTDVCYCRDEAGNGKSIQLADGKAYTYAFLIQMPKGNDAIAVGKDVRVMDGESVRAKGTIRYSRKDQMHTRAWV